MPVATPTSLPRRHRALAELDGVIEKTERERARHLLDLEIQGEIAKGKGPAQMRLRMVEERLQHLYQSRNILLSDTLG